MAFEADSRTGTDEAGRNKAGRGLGGGNGEILNGIVGTTHAGHADAGRVAERPDRAAAGLATAGIAAAFDVVDIVNVHFQVGIVGEKIARVIGTGHELAAVGNVGGVTVDGEAAAVLKIPVGEADFVAALGAVAEEGTHGTLIIEFLLDHCEVFSAR